MKRPVDMGRARDEIRKMSFEPSFRVLLCFLCAVLLLSCGRGAKWPVPLQPVLEEAAEYEARDNCQNWKGPSVSVSVCPVDWIDAESDFAGGKMKNPFGEDPMVMSRLVFFSVKLENHSEEKLFFNPLWASLFAGAAVPKTPLDVSAVYRMNRDDSEAEDRARAFRKTVFDGTCSLSSGDVMERYLVFPPPKDTFQEMMVVLQDIYLGSRDYDPAFVFIPEDE